MNKSALVIGGSSGIGLATVKLLLQQGYTVYNASRSPCPETQVINITTDVSVAGAVRNAVAAAAASESLEIIVYSAGFSMACPLELADECRYRYLFEVNFFGAIETLKAALPLMSQGKIIAVSSVASAFPIEYDPYYCASKAALEMFFHTAQLELDRRISLCVVLPGGTATPFSFKREICQSGGEGMHTAARRLCEIEQGGMSAESVAKTIMRIIKMKNPPQRIAAGTANKLAVAAAKVMPKKLLLKIAKKIYS